MNETEFAIISERVQQFRLVCDSMESRLRQVELLQSSLDKSMAIAEVGIKSTAGWVQQVQEETINLREDRVIRYRYWLSVLISVGALLTSIITLIIRVVGG